MSDCTCAAPGHCPVFNRDMTPRELEICRGEYMVNPLPEETRQQFLDWWRVGAPTQTNPTPVQATHDEPPASRNCPHLWKRVRDETGAVATRECQVCGGGRKLDLFECRCSSRRQPGGVNDRITLLDCMTCAWRPRPVADDAKKLILRNHLSPGDVLVMTAAVHSVQRQHPGKFRFAVDTTAQPLWEHNPDVESLETAQREQWEVLQTHYPLVNQSNQRGVHMMMGYCDFFEFALKVPVPLLTNRPMLYISPEEKSWMHQVEQTFGYKGKFWLLNAGVKQDFTAKQYPFYQEVVDRLRGKVTFVQVGEKHHLHKPLRGVFDLLGNTDLRQLVRLVQHAQGVLCGTTLLMHMAAALEKPAVVVAGGREPRPWNTYPFQTLLSTVGALPCCLTSACWRSRAVKLNDGCEQDGSLCERPEPTDPPAGRCMTLIGPEQVAASVEMYLAGNAV